MEQSSSVLGAALQRAAQCSGWARREMLAGEAMANRNQARAALTTYRIRSLMRLDFLGRCRAGVGRPARARAPQYPPQSPTSSGLWRLGCTSDVFRNYVQNDSGKKKLDPWQGRSLD